MTLDTLNNKRDSIIAKLKRGKGDDWDHLWRQLAEVESELEVVTARSNRARVIEEAVREEIRRIRALGNS